MTDEASARRRLHPLTVLLRLAGNLPSAVLGLPALFAVVTRGGLAFFLAVMAAGLIIFALVHWLIWRRFTYRIGAADLVIESGLFNRSRRTIPFDRIQDVDYERGLLQRVFGLVKVRIETGGAAKDEGTLDSLSLEDADRLRAAVRGGQGRSPPDPIAATDAPIFAMSPRRVVLAGLFGFSLLWMAGIFAVLQQVDGFLSFDIRDAGRWIGIAEHELAAGPRILLGAILLAAAILLGLASGVVSSVLRNFGFRLTAEAHGFHRARGLLTRSEVVIPIGRIQLALIRSGPLRRRLGWYRLDFQTLGGGAAAQDGGLQDAAPFARLGEIDAILAGARGLRRPDPATLVRVSSSHIWKIVAAAATGPIVPIVIATVFMPMLILTALAIPLLVIAAIVERRWHRYAFEDDLLFVQSGWWHRRLWIVPVAGIQAITISRSWLQRRLDIASLRFDTAGASMFGGPGISDIRGALAETLAEAIVARNRHNAI